MNGRKVLLGISGGIAAYKCCELVRIIKKGGGDVRVVLTKAAEAFITPLTLQALSGEPVRTSLLDPSAEMGMGHIELARWADLMVLAPATADLMAKVANGFADDLLTTVVLARRSGCLLAIVPAMNASMWANDATQENRRILESRADTLILGPGSGVQACGDVGEGRMLEPAEIAAHISALLNRASSESVRPPIRAGSLQKSPHIGVAGKGGRASPIDHRVQSLLKGRRVVVTTGPTREAIDPVRYVTNHSSGKMGYAMAEACLLMGATELVIIAGPCTASLAQLGCVDAEIEVQNVTSAAEMLEAVIGAIASRPTDLFISAAAVCDFRTATSAEHKLKKTDGEDGMTLHMVKNPDIVATVASHSSRPQIVIGFAAETREVIAYAKDKLVRKNLDAILANDVSVAGTGFNSDDNAAWLVWRKAAHVEDDICVTEYEKRTKSQLGIDVMTKVAQIFFNR